MVTPLDVLTLPEAKAAVNLKQTTEHDAELARWVTAVSLRLDELVGPVVRRAVTDELDGGDCSVYLSTYPVATITSVREYGRYGTETELAPETLTVKPEHAFKAQKYSANPTLLSNELGRRQSGYGFWFACTVVVAYIAGRFADTSSVDERFKAAARLMLKNVWRSEMDATQSVNEFDVPQSNFPTYVISKAVKDMFPGELQGHYL